MLEMLLWWKLIMAFITVAWTKIHYFYFINEAYCEMFSFNFWFNCICGPPSFPIVCNFSLLGYYPIFNFIAPHIILTKCWLRGVDVSFLIEVSSIGQVDSCGYLKEKKMNSLKKTKKRKNGCRKIVTWLAAIHYVHRP